MRRLTLRWTPGILLAGVILFADRAVAHVGGLSGTATSAATVPTWLTAVTGGVIIGASFLFTSLLTDHAAIRAVNRWRVSLPAPVTRRTIARVVRGIGVAVLVVIILSGLFGPRTPTTNFAILAVWAGWWAGYTMSVYLIGNTWPAINPWRTIAAVLPRLRRRDYPEWVGAWPSVIGLLGMVWIEVVSPVAEEPRLLVVLVLVYSAVTLLGAVVYGVEPWFGIVDPIARVFEYYGYIAPFQRSDDGIEFKLPTAALAERRIANTPGEMAFVIALLWVTTYDGFVSTPAWATVTRPIVDIGVPAILVYFVTIVAGFGVFYWVYRLASRKARRTAHTYVAAEFIQRWFVLSLLPIAAGYHVAHFLGYFLSLLPALVTVAGHPIAGVSQVSVLVIPDWFGGLELLFILVGHLLAVWVAHASSFDLFPGTLKPIRSQYPFIVVMIFYTITSMWIVTQPLIPPPYV